MSSQSSQQMGADAWTLSCTFCDCTLTENVLALQSYPGEAASLPAGIPDHGGLTLCPDCASEVAELLVAWQHHEQPPINQGRTIADGYQEVASECSFCTDSCGRSVLGIELYRRIGDTLPAYANYTLCESCQSVFGEFLRNIRTESVQ